MFLVIQTNAVQTDVLQSPEAFAADNRVAHHALILGQKVFFILQQIPTTRALPLRTRTWQRRFGRILFGSRVCYEKHVQTLR